MITSKNSEIPKRQSPASKPSRTQLSQNLIHSKMLPHISLEHPQTRRMRQTFVFQGFLAKNKWVCERHIPYFTSPLGSWFFGKSVEFSAFTPVRFERIARIAILRDCRLQFFVKAHKDIQNTPVYSPVRMLSPTRLGVSSKVVRSPAQDLFFCLDSACRLASLYPPIRSRLELLRRLHIH